MANPKVYLASFFVLLQTVSSLATPFKLLGSTDLPIEYIEACRQSKYGDYSTLTGVSHKNGLELFYIKHSWNSNSIETTPIPWLTDNHDNIQIKEDLLAISGQGGVVFLNMTTNQRINAESNQSLQNLNIKSTIEILDTNFLSMMGHGIKRQWIIDSTNYKIAKEITIPGWQRLQLNIRFSPYIFMTGHNSGLDLVDFTIAHFFSKPISPIFLLELIGTHYMIMGPKKETILYGGNNGYIFLANTTSLRAIEDHNLGYTSGNPNNKFAIENFFPGGQLLVIKGPLFKKLMIYDLKTKLFIKEFSTNGAICTDLENSRISKFLNEILYFYEIESQYSCSNPNCLRCDYSPDICQACKNPKISFNYSCIDECPPGFQPDLKKGACVINPCLENQILKKDNTCGCQEGEEIKMQVCVCVNKICCAKNEFFKNGQCNLCKKNSIFSEKKNKCLNCQEAVSNCKSCEPLTLGCKNCEKGYELKNNGKCILQASNLVKEVTEKFISVLAKTNKIIIYTIGFVNSEIKKNSLRLYQAIKFLTLFERNYDKLTTKLINIFLDSFYTSIDYRVFAPKEESIDNRKDKVSENMDQNFFRNTDSNLQLALVNIVFSILMILTKNIYKGKITVFNSFLSIYNIALIVDILSQLAIEFLIAASIGLFYPQESNTKNILASLLTILFYFVIIIIILIIVYYYPAEKVGELIFYRISDVKPHYKYKKRNILFTINWMAIYSLQSFFVIIFRGNIIFQGLLLSGLQLIPLIIWCSNKTIFIFESKTKTIIEFVKETIAFLIFLSSIFQHFYLDKFMFILIIVQILLSGATTFLEIFWSISYIFSLEINIENTKVELENELEEIVLQEKNKKVKNI